MRIFQKMKENFTCKKQVLIHVKKNYFRLRAYGEKTLWEASELMGYSPRTIDRINRKIKKKITKVAPMYIRGFSLYNGGNVAK